MVPSNINATCLIFSTAALTASVKDGYNGYLNLNAVNLGYLHTVPCLLSFCVQSLHTISLLNKTIFPSDMSGIKKKKPSQFPLYSL